ncbi:2-succinyl-5-enolpyruvyl-6-hydroxy-3-cyclohexene-1-carboxylic-acid synthase [Thiocapsa roseopersicina]|uniref:2-succinyl-5-enolpyruvyl-6-hydroxy-3-cyclohexene-1-carboxylate synthase n=1 Tax=Thiocapsa roseopersicina TaxID=1058 RepID=A0A1H2WXS1_THIRO|nr:2-succinyl-5-enolpyruvyl-6-hydroxy-3-cyclohexene-1-carboxylic-acid synthase [Thiocapsa roseopersicina]SDW85473.1 2-succinyl-5-enolpyruvyl-6-hydroxy-3-cyclohexene-1-carboxylate synthase [Thiocapsa roseopersicina]
MSDAETPDQGCRNLRWALALFDGLVSGGVRRVVLSPGSRSTPLVLAAQRQPLIELTPILDERSAAFFALGLAQASARPVALLCTSGSALAHWFPAVIESSESGVPLILLSADRPPELRGWGANQTIDQTRLFGGFTRECHDPGPAEEGPAALKAIRALGLRAALVSRGPRPGPVHLNLPFREPLVPGPSCTAEPFRAFGGAEAGPHDGSELRSSAMDQACCFDTPQWPQELTTLLRGRGIICCGPMMPSDAAAEAIFACAELLDAPVLADPLSGLRFRTATAARITRYDSLLRNPEAAAALRPDWVIRFGGTAVSKTLSGWIEDVPSILVDPAERWTDPNHDVIARISADPIAFCRLLQTRIERNAQGPWIERWAAAEQTLDRLASAFLQQSPWCEGHLIADLLERLPAGDGLFCANSLPIRQLDTWSGQSDKPLRVFGHRGASGIDGQSSTLSGLNAGRIAPTRGVTGLLGDLSFIHDLSGLLLMERLDRPCIVLNNGGGRIFDALPQRGLPGFEPLWRTPQRVQPEALARAFGLAHRSVDDASGFAQAWAEAIDAGMRAEPAGLIEVRLDAELSLRTHRAFWNGVREQSIIESE